VQARCHVKHCTLQCRATPTVWHCALLCGRQHAEEGGERWPCTQNQNGTEEILGNFVHCNITYGHFLSFRNSRLSCQSVSSLFTRATASNLCSMTEVFRGAGAGSEVALGMELDRARLRTKRSDCVCRKERSENINGGP
jgi:hypothetical protein